MTFSRRSFMQLAAALAVTTPHALFPEGVSAAGFRPDLLPSQKEAWDWLVWMAKLGPKYTGNPAHVQYVDFLASQLESLGLTVSRDRYTLPRWDARRWEITVHPRSGQSFKAPVTSYYPYSGRTPAEGVTGELVYLGTFASLDPATVDHTRSGGNARAAGSPRPLPHDVRGKIAFIDCPVLPTNMREWFQVRAANPKDMVLPADFRRTNWGTAGMLTDLKAAGADGVILGWTDISDENAADQYVPFGRAHQDLPALYVGRTAGARLRDVARSGAKATLVLEAAVTPNSPTDTIYAPLEGTSPNEVIIVQSHTDGPNALEENGGIGVIALAKYFSRIPKADRRRTLMFVLTTGHFAGAYVPSMRGFVSQHQDIIKKTVASLTIEHLGALEYVDDASLRYVRTGKNEPAIAQTALNSTARLMADCLEGTNDREVAVVTPNPGHRWSGEGGSLSAAGVPAIGYITIPNYLCAGPPNGCIDKLSPERLHAEITLFANVIHRMDAMSAAQLRGERIP